MFFILWVPWALLVPKAAGQGDGASKRLKLTMNTERSHKTYPISYNTPKKSLNM